MQLGKYDSTLKPLKPCPQIIYIYSCTTLKIGGKKLEKGKHVSRNKDLTFENSTIVKILMGV